MQPETAIGHVGGADIFAGRQQVVHRARHQRREGNLEGFGRARGGHLTGHAVDIDGIVPQTGAVGAKGGAGLGLKCGRYVLFHNGAMGQDAAVGEGGLQDLRLDRIAKRPVGVAPRRPLVPGRARRAARTRSCRWTVPPCRRIWSKPSCSGMKKALSPTPIAPGAGCWRRPARARPFSTKSASCRCRCRPSC